MRTRNLFLKNALESFYFNSFYFLCFCLLFVKDSSGKSLQYPTVPCCTWGGADISSDLA